MRMGRKTLLVAALTAGLLALMANRQAKAGFLSLYNTIQAGTMNEKIASLESQVSQMTSKINELETRLEKVENKTRKMHTSNDDE